MIDSFIKVMGFGVEVNYYANSFSNTSEYHIIDELFSRMLMEKNAKVSKQFSEQTKEMANQIFKTIEDLNYFEKFVKNYKNEKTMVKKRWWKFWK